MVAKGYGMESLYNTICDPTSATFYLCLSALGAAIGNRLAYCVKVTSQSGNHDGHRSLVLMSDIKAMAMLLD